MSVGPPSDQGTTWWASVKRRWSGAAGEAAAAVAEGEQASLVGGEEPLAASECHGDAVEVEQDGEDLRVTRDPGHARRVQQARTAGCLGELACRQGSRGCLTGEWFTEQDLQVGALTADGGQQLVVGGGADDVEEPVGPSLGRGPEVFWTGRDQEGLQGGVTAGRLTRRRGVRRRRSSRRAGGPASGGGGRTAARTRPGCRRGRRPGAGAGPRCGRQPPTPTRPGPTGARPPRPAARPGTNRTARSIERRWS